MKNKTNWKALLTVICVVALAPASQAVLVLSDTFNAHNPSDNTDQNYNVGTRQSGILAGTTYSELGATWQTQVYSGGNRLDLYADAGAPLGGVSIDHNFTDYSSLTLAFDFANGGSPFQGFALGATQTDGHTTATGLSVRISDAGAAELYSGGALVTSFSVTSAVHYDFVANFTNTGYYDGTGLAILDLSINGTTVDLNGAAAGTTFTRTGLGSNNYINFFVNGNNSSFTGGYLGAYTGLTINGTVIPEPSVAHLVLVAFALFALLRHRRQTV
jgi:hypothetical protein